MQRIPVDGIFKGAARRLAAMLALGVVCGMGLAGCGATIADMPLIGLPKDAPPRKERGAFMPVNDLPAPRETVKMETPEQAKVRAELAASRDQQAAQAAAANKQ